MSSPIHPVQHFKMILSVEVKCSLIVTLVGGLKAPHLLLISTLVWKGCEWSEEVRGQPYDVLGGLETTVTFGFIRY